MYKLPSRWQDVRWMEIQQTTFKWQQAIYSASKAKDVKTVRKYQHRILSSNEAKLLAVRRVTQDNRGKATAGVDGQKRLTTESRLKLVKTLCITGKASPLRRVWIPKPGKVEKRPLGIPTITDRCRQALFKMALEPEWEAKFEADSYGFRPGRNCHDAVSAVRSYIQKRPKYVLDADIAKCFDRINHDYLLDKIGMKGLYRKQLKAWLKSGVLDGATFSDTELGTPQGGVISPLLANIALHGMADYLREAVKDIPVLGRTGKPVKPSRRGETVGFVRYADDFVITHPDLKVVLILRDKVKEFLQPIGLELSEAKTRITHTLDIDPSTIDDCPGLEGKPGFNFLGFFFRQWKSRHRAARGPDGKLLGFYTLIIPSKEKRDAHQQKLHKLVLQDGKGMSQDVLIKKLNAVIRGWSSYFGKSDANTCNLLTQMDYLLYLKLRRWAKRVKKTAGKAKSCFKKVGTRTWTFATHKAVMVSHDRYSLPLSQYEKVQGDFSPYDTNQIYWAKRLPKNNVYNSRVTALIKRQKGKCTWCKATFHWDEVMEVDHIKPLSKGGKDDLTNLQLLHGHCHDTKSLTDNS